MVDSSVVSDEDDAENKYRMIADTKSTIDMINEYKYQYFLLARQLSISWHSTVFIVRHSGGLFLQNIDGLKIATVVNTAEMIPKISKIIDRIFSSPICINKRYIFFLLN